jgi:hypothetical protein
MVENNLFLINLIRGIESMNELKDALMEGLTPILIDLLIVSIGIGITYATGLLKQLKQYLVTKYGVTTYDRAREIAIGLYYALEDEFKEIAKAGEQKKQLMQQKLLEVIPTLTQVELDALNKEIWYMLDEKAKESGILDPAYEDDEDDDYILDELDEFDDPKGTDEFPELDESNAPSTGDEEDEEVSK